MRISDWSSDVCSSDLLVDRHESQIAIHRHGFSRAEKPARLVRQDLFLARDERNLILALDRHYAVIDLPRQQPEGKADHAARRSEERRVWKECVSTCRSRCAPYH